MAKVVENLNKQNLPLLTFVMIIFSGFGLWFLTSKGVAVAELFFTMFLFFIAILVLIQFFLKDDDTYSLITRNFKFPFTTSLLVDVSSYLIFSFVAILIAFIPVGQGFTVSDLSIPLSSAGEIGGQLLSAVSIEQSASNRTFMGAVLPGIYESLFYNFTLIFAGALVVSFIYVLLTEEKSLLGISKKNFVTIFALLFSSGSFMLSHLLNSTYEGSMFFKAGLFLLLTNVLIYYLKVPISGIIGYHTMNNIIWIMGNYGVITTLKGFISIFGLVYIPLHILMILYFFNNIDKVPGELKSQLGV